MMFKTLIISIPTRTSAIAEGPRYAIVSINSADTRRRHIPRLTERRAVKIDHIALPTKYNYQAMSVGR